MCSEYESLPWISFGCILDKLSEQDFRVARAGLSGPAASLADFTGFRRNSMAMRKVNRQRGICLQLGRYFPLMVHIVGWNGIRCPAAAPQPQATVCACCRTVSPCLLT